jgi:hypothetical protein
VNQIKHYLHIALAVELLSSRKWKLKTMGDVVESREWYVAAYCPEGVPTSDHLKLRTVSLSLASDSIPDNHLAVETLLLSVDPFLRGTITGTVEGLFISR